jgi:hypothetical protein
LGERHNRSQTVVAMTAIGPEAIDPRWSSKVTTFGPAPVGVLGKGRCYQQLVLGPGAETRRKVPFGTLRTAPPAPYLTGSDMPQRSQVVAIRAAKQPAFPWCSAAFLHRPSHSNRRKSSHTKASKIKSLTCSQLTTQRTAKKTSAYHQARCTSCPRDRSSAMRTGPRENSPRRALVVKSLR